MTDLPPLDPEDGPYDDSAYTPSDSEPDVEPIYVGSEYGGDDYFGQEITVTDFWGESESHTKSEWMEILTVFDKGELADFSDLDMGHIDIIYDLYDQGYWDEYDWAYFRENYG